MVMFWNTTGIIYQTIQGWNLNVTGSMMITFFILLILFILAGIIFHMSIDLIWLVTLPLVIIIGAFQPIFIPVVAIWILYLGIVMFKIFRSLISGY